jgi:hypothetical protein
VEDFPTRIADLLESIATRVRSLTVDKVARGITFATLGLVAFVLVAMAFIFLLIGVFRIVEDLVIRACDCEAAAMEISYGIVGGLFLIIGVLVWARRTRPDDEDST